jgi:hypothetical protein
MLNRRNGRRHEKLLQELAVMGRLPEMRTQDWSRWSGKVTAYSTVNVKHNVYSVDSRLIGELIEVRVHAEMLEVWYGGGFIERIPRLRGSSKHHIQYRHIIDSLVRKPGLCALSLQNDLFPSVMFRVAYDYLRERSRWCGSAVRADPAGRSSGKRATVDEALRYLVERGETITVERVREWVKSPVEFDCRH